ncbi:MAG: hypothetical protein GXY83_05885 [Rhodopirellula sp.]|mgnify:CR=1 FL=1|nr:hypothetical protein [Rhodopirellula sp.]
MSVAENPYRSPQFAIAAQAAANERADFITKFCVTDRTASVYTFSV